MESKSLEEILIIEDDLIVSRMHQFSVKNVLQKEVRTFENGKTAGEYLEKKQPKQKLLVLLDLNMPVMNGWEFLDFVSSRCYSENLCIAVVTSSPYKADLIKVKKYDQVLGVYTKPFKKADLLEILELVGASETISRSAE